MFHRKGFLIVLVAVIILVLGVGVAQAIPPAQQGAAAGITIPYAGRLDDEAGLAVPDGDYAFTFALYDAATGGTLLWSEVQEEIAVEGGSFVASLGRVTPLPEAMLAGGALWLEVAVRGPEADAFTTLAPRQALRAAGTAPTAGVNQAAPCAHDHWGESWGESGTGVAFPGPFVALYGHSDVWAGVMGQSTSNIAVYGLSTSSDGVRGSSTDGYGVRGDSAADDGAFFDSGSDYYLDGDVALGGDVGSVVAHASNASELYLSARGNVTIKLDADQTIDPGTHVFNVRNGLDFDACWVEEAGNLDCIGTKSAVVTTADYGRHKLYAVESPEVWHEDLGSATLIDGQATVPFEPIFAQTVNLEEEYYVFLTPQGGYCALYIAEKTPASFTVRAQEGESCDIAFDYRIVAKRLGY